MTAICSFVSKLAGLVIKQVERGHMEKQGDCAVVSNYIRCWFSAPGKSKTTITQRLYFTACVHLYTANWFTSTDLVSLSEQVTDTTLSLQLSAVQKETEDNKYMSKIHAIKQQRKTCYITKHVFYERWQF